MAAAGLAVGAVAVAVPATGAGAVGGLQHDGLSAWVKDEQRNSFQLNKLINDITRTRAKVVRVNLFWGSVAPGRPGTPRNHNDPAFRWGPYDQIFTALRRKGIKPLVAVFDYPAWSSGRQAPFLRGVRPQTRQPYNPNAPRRAKDFENFMFALARRYSGRQRAVRMFETCNEANLKSFFRKGSRSNVAAFAKLHRAAWKGIRAGNPRAKVVLCAFGPNSSGRNGNIAARRWLTGLTRQPKMNWHAVGAHIYPPTPPRARNPRRVFPRWDSIPEIQRIIRNARGPARNRRAPILITEAGYTTKRTPFRRTRVTEAQQARYIRQIFQLPSVRTTRGRNPVALVVQFNHTDNRFWPGGVVRANGRKKPAYNVFRGIARRPIPGRYRSLLV